MRLTTTLAAATAIAFSATTVTAGGLAPAVDNGPVVIVNEAKNAVTKAATSSINPGFIVLGLTAVLIAAAAAD